MCKGTTNNRNEQVQTDFFDLFDVKKKVEVSFTAPDMTNLGGLPVLLRVMRDDDFLLRLSRQIHDWRNPDYITHTMSDLITQRVLQIAAGYEDADDCDLLRHDSMMKLAVGRLPGGDDLCSQPTMTRLENHVGVRELYAIGKLFMRHFVESYDKEPDKIVIDLDDSNADTYGCQQLSLFNTFYGGYCYMPLFVFEGISGKLMLPLLRPGRTSKRTNVFRLIRRIRGSLLVIIQVIDFTGDPPACVFCSHPAFFLPVRQAVDSGIGLVKLCREILSVLFQLTDLFPHLSGRACGGIRCLPCCLDRSGYRVWVTQIPVIPFDVIETLKRLLVFFR